MRGSGERWKLDELIDFEVALEAWDGVSQPAEPPGAGSRSAVFKNWWRESGMKNVGKTWLSSLNWAALLLGLIAFVAGFGAAWGCYDVRREGVNVVFFLAVTLLLPWLVFLAGVAAWLLNRRRAGFLVGTLKRLASKFSGEKGREAMARIGGNPELAKAAGWRIAWQTQRIAGDFHFGAIGGLMVMLFFRKVGFFWESTTEKAMQLLLEGTVNILGMPVAWIAPDLLPDVAATRRGAAWDGGGVEWAMFLILSLSLWGFVLRNVLAAIAQLQEWRTLRAPAFESPRHRKLWRVLTGVRRGEDPAGPADGALVIDLGGVKVDRDFLRPFFLRRLRLNPVAWETTGVLDAGREVSARKALAKAPAGIVLLVEGWSLAPRQVEDVLRRALDTAEERRIVLYVADFDGEGRPREAGAAEREAWAAFADGLAGVEVELVFYEEERTWAPG